MLSTFVFNETSPAAAGVAASSQPVGSGPNFFPPGVAGPLDNADGVDVLAELVGAAGGTLDLYLQTSPDSGTTWVDAIHFPQLASGAGAIKYRATLSPHPQSTSDAPVAVGTGLSPALAVDTVVQGTGFDRCRLVTVAGAGTTAGAAVKVIVSVDRKAGK